MKRCKIGVMNDEDMISQLSEDLILHILSQLETREAIATSVLSKKWQYLWKMIPKLKFDDDHYKHKRDLGTFSKYVCLCLLSHKAPVVQSLHLKIREINTIDTEILIGIAFGRIVRKLVLEFTHYVINFPRSLYTCETLETLKLMSRILMDVPSLVCLKSLRTLRLHQVDYKDQESFVRFLSGCPELETLTIAVNPSRYDSIDTFTITVPSLQRLSVYNSYNCGILVDAPSLKYLKIQGIYQIRFFHILNGTKLVEATVTDVSGITDDNILSSLTSVKRLSLNLSPLQIQSPVGSIFNQLVYLEVYTRKDAWWNLLTVMLDSSPNLQVLKLIDLLGWRKDLPACPVWNQPKSVPECLLIHLETFMWKGYEWTREEEKEVAKYILRNADYLKRATISSKPIGSDQEKVEMVKELESVPRASNSCQLKFE